MVDGPSGVRVARQASLWWTRSERPSPIGANVENMSKGRAVSNAVRTTGSMPRSLPAQRHRHDESASAAGVGFHSQVSVVHAGYLSRQPEAQARALDVLRAVHATEPGEKVDLVLRADPHAAVDDRDRGHAVAAPDANGDAGPGGGVLGGVAQEVSDHDLDTVRVQVGFHGFGRLVDVERVAAQQHSHAIDRPIRDLDYVAALLVELQAALLETRRFEHLL